MSTQTNNAGDPADSTAQLPAANPSQGDAPPAGASSTPVSSEPSAPQAFSGIWFQEEDSQIMIRWTVSEVPALPASPSSSAEPSPGNSSYKAQVRIYQQIFDAELPAQLPAQPPVPQPRSVVPFSVTDPSVGSTPYLQGSLVLSQAPPGLEVFNMRFPGFPSQNLTLYPAPAAESETAPSGASSSGAGPAGTGAAAGVA